MFIDQLFVYQLLHQLTLTMHNNPGVLNLNTRKLAVPFKI